MKRKIPHH